MALSNNQANAVLKMFAQNFINETNETERKNMLINFTDNFKASIDCLEDRVLEALNNCGASETDTDALLRIFNLKSDTSISDEVKLCKLSLDDEDQIVRLISKELGNLPHFSSIPFNIGTIEDFKKSDVSFVAKINDDVIGVILAQEVFEYGSYIICVSIFVVNEAVQNHGIGRKMMGHLMKITRSKRENCAYKIFLHTKKNRKAYDIYKHWGFSDQESDSVYLTKWFV